MTAESTRYALFSLLALATGSCTKEDLPGPEVMHAVESKAEPVDFIPVYEGCDAVLVAIANYDFGPANGSGNETVTGSARALFPDTPGNYLNVGNVMSQDVLLTRKQNNLYAIDPSPSLPGGLNFISAPVYRWTMEGNANFPAISFICTTGFPVISALTTSAVEIDRQSDFTVGTALPMDDADSVRFWIFAPNGYLYADAKGSHQAHTFASAKLHLLAKGEGYLRVTAFNSVSLKLNGRNIRYINESVTTRAVVIR